jgi:hypothetical protein
VLFQASDTPAPRAPTSVAWRLAAVITGAAVLVAAMGVVTVAVLVGADPVILEPASGADENTARHTVFSGTGAWVDVYDYARDYQPAGADPPVTPDDVETMAAQGVTTLYIQTAGTGEGPALADAEVLGRFMDEAHGRGLHVVGWVRPELHRSGTRLGTDDSRAQLLR